MLRRHGYGRGPNNTECTGSYGPPSADHTVSLPTSSNTTTTTVTVGTSVSSSSNDVPQPTLSMHVSASAKVSLHNHRATRCDNLDHPAASQLACGAVGPNYLEGEGQPLPAPPFVPTVSPSKVLKWIPKGARGAAASLLQSLLLSVTDDPSDISAWSRLLGFAPACFGRPDRGGGGRSDNLTKVVLRSIAEYGRGKSNYSNSKVGSGGVYAGMGYKKKN